MYAIVVSRLTSYPLPSQVFCIAEEETEAEELKADVKKFLYDLRMQAEVIVVTMKSWEDNHEDTNVVQRDGAMDAFSKARKRISVRVEEMKQGADGPTKFETDYTSFNDHQVRTFVKILLTRYRIYSKPLLILLVSGVL